MDRQRKHIAIVEVTIPFETNICDAHERKAAKYAPLVAALVDNGFDCEFHSFVIGSRGIAAQGSCRTIRQLCKSSRKDSKTFVKRLCHTVLKCSFSIFLGKGQ